MMRIEKTTAGELRLIQLPALGLGEAAYKEVTHLQQMILASPDAFFGEIGEALMVVGSEIRPRPDVVGDRIDILALDPSGAVVVVELKRDHDKLQLLQALTYAAMLRSWKLGDFVAQYAAPKGVEANKATEELADFLGSAVEKVNDRQRVILVAESFDFQVLATVEWLSEVYGVGVKCVKITLRVDGEAHYMNAETIFPASPLLGPVGNLGGPTAVPLASWKDVCALITEPSIENLARTLASALPTNDVSPKYWALYVRVKDRRMVELNFRRDRVYVWQQRRFKGDQDFWQTRLGTQIDLQEVRNGTALRFYLRTSDQCDRFMNCYGLLQGQDYAPSNPVKDALETEADVAESFLNDEAPEPQPTRIL